MKAVIYARYSSDNQREESIDGQLRECKEFAERQNLTIVKEKIEKSMLTHEKVVHFMSRFKDGDIDYYVPRVKTQFLNSYDHDNKVNVSNEVILRHGFLLSTA